VGMDVAARFRLESCLDRWRLVAWNQHVSHPSHPSHPNRYP